MTLPPGARDRVDILGVPVDRLDALAALERIDDFLTSGQPHHVVTVNPEYVMAARRDAAFMAVLRAADLAVADGVGVVLAARLLGAPVPERVAGVDLVPRIAIRAAGRGGVFLLGAAPGVAELAGAKLRGLAAAAGHVAPEIGAFSGGPSDGEAEAISALIRGAAPAVLLVAFGAPRQDLWIARHGAQLGVPVMMGVGGSFDYLAGMARRAPAPVRTAGLEWLWRLALEPWRWRRQLALPSFAAAVLRQRLTRGGAL